MNPSTPPEVTTQRDQLELLAQHRQVLDAITDLVLVKGPGSRILWANKAFREAYGMTNDELQGLIDAPFVEPDATQQYIRDDAQVFATGETLVIADEPVTMHDGTIIRVHTVKSPIFDANGKVVMSVGVSRDITDQSRMEARLRHAERMVSIGTLAAGVAHEVNNPLAYMMSNLTACAEVLANPGLPLGPDAVAELRALVEETARGAERVRRIVRGLKAFSRTSDELREAVVLSSALQDAINIVHNELRHRATLVRDFGPVPIVEGDTTLLVQVFVNLLLNAVQALPEGAADSHQVTVATRTDESGRAVVEITDTGCGIEPALVARIFDPFFTTKAIGEGTGLGLSTSHGIISALGGDISVSSAIGHGSQFRITLPASVVAAPPQTREHVTVAAAAPAPTTPPRRGSVLVLDDDPLVAASLVRILRAEHDVVPLTNGREALTRLRAGEHFDVFMCDLMMPDLSGVDVYQDLAASAPDQLARLVFMTGGTFSGPADDLLRTVPNEVVEKPFRIDKVRALVRRMVG